MERPESLVERLSFIGGNRLEILTGSVSQNSQVTLRIEGIDQEQHDSPENNSHASEETTSISERPESGSSSLLYSLPPVSNDYNRSETGSNISIESDRERSPKIGEEPKIVSSEKKRTTLALSALFHFPAIVVTLLFVGLYAGGALWPWPDPSNNVLNAIQFAAKVHEGLIVGSLTQIVFHRLRYELLGEHGVPFGLVAASFQISSIPFFFTQAFWSSIIAKRSFRHISTSILLFLALVLAVVSGPSSAIVMLPRLGWSPLPNTFGTPLYGSKAVPRDQFIGSAFSSLYPTNISGENSRLDVCTEWFAATGNYPTECPSSGWRELVASLTAIFLSSQGSVAMKKDLNLPVSALVGSRIISSGGLSRGDAALNNTAVYATSPADFLMSALNWKSSRILESNPSLIYRVKPNLAELRDGRSTPWMQPLMLVQCSSNAIEVISYKGDKRQSDDIFFSFPNGMNPPFNISLSTAFLREVLKVSSETNHTSDTTRIAFAFVDLGDKISFPISAAAIFAHFQSNQKSSLDENATFVDEPLFSTVEVCILEATWIESHAEVLRNSTAEPVPWTNTNIDLGTIVDTTSPQRQIINLGMDWINSLNTVVPVIGNINDTENTNFFDYIASFCSGAALRQTCQSVFLASFMVDAISRLQLIYQNVYFFDNVNGSGLGYNEIHSAPYIESTGSNMTPALQEDDIKDMSLYTNIPIVVSKQAYGFRLDNLTVILAMAILLLHVALVVAHILISLIGRPWSSNAWSGLGELLALAIQSNSTKLLENTGAGTSKADTWKLTATVREAESDNRLQLVISDEQNDMVSPGVKGEKSEGIPKADWKYG
ncbi:hypothetical protein K445DRAFT_367224 [Daldinia sp. EC12]|nr:hypothetical protein K445DRAFT_367224 [Daldinia sp. EC12]